MATDIGSPFSTEESYFGQVRLKKDDGIDINDPNNIVVMKNIHKTYLLGIEGVPALRGVTMNIKRGEFVCIFGTSGGGKTTMLNLIGTIDKPTKGDMKLCGKMINHKTTDKDLAYIRLKNIGFVFQTFNLLSSLTALENVEMPMILLGELSATERRERAISLLTKVGMKDRLDHIPSQLSGGEQQRVTIARAMANNPDILLLDEPTGDLDTVNTSVVMKLLTDLNKNENITLVMVTHDVGLKMYADRIIWMRDGKIQRFESVQTDARREHYARLDREIQLIQQNQKGGVTSVLNEKSKNRGSSVTEIRKPTDYKSIASYSAAADSSITNDSVAINHSNSGLRTSTSPNVLSGSPFNIENNHNLSTSTSSNISLPILNHSTNVVGLNNSSSSMKQQKILLDLEDDEPASSSSYNSVGGMSGSTPLSISNNTIRTNNDVYLQINEQSSQPYSKNSIDSITEDIERIL
ncbi:putative non-transporter ABC protein [Heterostelium album PN500]|uniref:Putative non-transporter ABC protein n=1 Tax=Heterostelium pallidum (strain ATCC 26659 / Pp 5 / PN500) TaxID=670386 RepID=D3B0C5_HETP5|nr:putative non-transporter ABC protein [Heterostelium album PN500]EFA84749.1 putative non-transporter ABC protein [Heterostelium album PN500]|eukprot:XP_020436861.1 putative non-transporter ABC protein [Heterostelium album PN500]